MAQHFGISQLHVYLIRPGMTDGLIVNNRTDGAICLHRRNADFWQRHLDGAPQARPEMAILRPAQDRVYVYRTP
jgi:hypothetical protein